MRFSYVLQMAKGYSMLAFTAALAAVLVMFFAIVIYSKLYKHEEKDLPWTKFIAVGMIVFYLTIVFCATMLNRGRYETPVIRPGVFETYMEAWYSADMVQWRNLVLNIMMFVPIGFLLPFGLKIFRKPWVTYISCLLITLCIESLQYMFRCGMFEVDDLINNTLGGLIGYGCFRLVIMLKNILLDRRIKWKVTLLSQLPLVCTVIAYVAVYNMYISSPYGNFKYDQVNHVKFDTVETSKDLNIEEDISKVSVRKQKTYARNEVFNIASHALATIGFDINKSDCFYYDTRATCYANGRVAAVWVNYQAGTYELQNYTQYKDSHQNDIPLIKDASEQEIRDALEPFGITIPENAQFSVDEEGMYTFMTPEDLQSTQKMTLSGFVRCRYTKNHIIQFLSNMMYERELQGSIDVISQKQAIEQIKQGNIYQVKVDDVKSFENKTYNTVMINSIQLFFTADSKGFFRPFYEASVILDGNINGTISLRATK